MSSSSTSQRVRGALPIPRVALCAGLLAAAAARLLYTPPTPRPAAEPSVEIARVQAPVANPAPPPAVLRDSLGAGETLSRIWERNGRPAEEMAAVVKAANAVFDIRQLRTGTPIEIYLGGPMRSPAAPQGSRLEAGARPAPGVDAGAPAAPGGEGDVWLGVDSVIVRIDADRRLAVRAEREGGFRGALHETPVREVWRTHVGCIEGSLHAALESEEGDYSLLALELDRIYGGQIDFYSDVHPGDCVALRFQTFVRPDGSFRLGRIESAEFVNRGRRYPAVYFEAPDGTADYYDPGGNSLKRQFLRSPLKFTRISSGFTLRRFHPILKRYRAHPGIDYAAPVGTPVQAAGNGVVVHAGWKGGYGKVVEIRHGKVYETSYAHLSGIARGIRRGARVSQGDVIGYVGSTGLSTGPHLDYRFSKYGKFVNPLNEKFVTGDPVARQYRALFSERRDRAVRALADAYRTILVDGAPTPGAPPAGEQASRGPLLAGPAAGASYGDD